MAIKTETRTPPPPPRKKTVGRNKEDKTLVSIRLDDRVVAAYKKKGDGWSTRLNDDIVKWMGLPEK